MKPSQMERTCSDVKGNSLIRSLGGGAGGGSRGKVRTGSRAELLVFISALPFELVTFANAVLATVRGRGGDGRIENVLDIQFMEENTTKSLQ
jgi:hypothetical protein